MFQKHLFTFFVISFLLTCLGQKAHSQEFNCNVAVSYNQLTGTDYQFLSEFKPLVEDYVNDRIWTEERFEVEEAIECSISIVFKSARGLDRFSAQITIGLERPIYGTMQRTRTITFNDDSWDFQFIPNQQIVHDPERFDPLASVLDFYAYMLLGYDYDTFSELGGTPYFQKAHRIAELAQTSGSTGWEYSSTNISRGQTIQQLMDPRMETLRKAYYTYHFLGLDHFLKSPDVARQNVLDMLIELERLSQEGNRLYVFDFFFQTKSAEMVALFENSNFSQQAYGKLLSIDPSRGSTYDKLVQ